MSPKLAKRRYLSRIIIVTVGYVGSLYGVVSVINANPDLPQATQVALTLLPALFVVATLAVMWKFFEELDEVARHFNMRAMNIATFTVLAISGSYGLIDMVVEGLPPLHIFWVFPIFFIVFALSKLTMKDVAC